MRRPDADARELVSEDMGALWRNLGEVGGLITSPSEFDFMKSGLKRSSLAARILEYVLHLRRCLAVLLLLSLPSKRLFDFRNTHAVWRNACIVARTG